MRILAAIAAAALALTPTVAVPALPVGARAPDFTTGGALAGRPFRLNLARELRHGPVVLYFYPQAFTGGCTLEAHAFSEAAADFRRAGATVVGMSADDYDTLRRFSVEGCRTPSRSRPPAGRRSAPMTSRSTTARRAAIAPPM